MCTYYRTIFTDCREPGHHQAEDWALWKCKNAELTSKICHPAAYGKRAAGHQKTRKCDQCYGTWTRAIHAAHAVVEHDQTRHCSSPFLKHVSAKRQTGALFSSVYDRTTIMHCGSLSYQNWHKGELCSPGHLLISFLKPQQQTGEIHGYVTPWTVVVDQTDNREALSEITFASSTISNPQFQSRPYLIAQIMWLAFWILKPVVTY